MTKIEIAERIQAELNFSKRDSSDLLESVISIIKSTLASGEDIKISGFGKFEVRQKADRRGRNPQTGESIRIGARRILTFKTSSRLREAINK